MNKINLPYNSNDAHIWTHNDPDLELIEPRILVSINRNYLVYGRKVCPYWPVMDTNGEIAAIGNRSDRIARLRLSCSVLARSSIYEPSSDNCQPRRAPGCVQSDDHGQLCVFRESGNQWVIFGEMGNSLNIILLGLSFGAKQRAFPVEKVTNSTGNPPISGVKLFINLGKLGNQRTLLRI
ncbi:hypothetical protein Y032_0036g3352 [Ancylostoma ceylanicum]|uniref:Uncharacterized protein n=1 Tax=Ancylostoma ceylanicum TaxID=53326 RepID=A0A016ULP6_9BILA|nr:hypothetical protein Y032_0036g3352 [Ancylostoma ceylanicum]